MTTPDAGRTPVPRSMARYRLDPDHPRPARARTGMDVTQVQTWVTTVLTVAVVGHFTAGLVLGAILIEHDAQALHHLEGAIGLDVLATLTAVVTVVAVRAIHRKPLLSPWLGVGLLVGALGFWMTFAI